MINVEEATLRKWEQRGLFPRAYRIGKRTLRWQQSDVERFIAGGYANKQQESNVDAEVASHCGVAASESERMALMEQRMRWCEIPEGLADWSVGMILAKIYVTQPVTVVPLDRIASDANLATTASSIIDRRGIARRSMKNLQSDGLITVHAAPPQGRAGRGRKTLVDFQVHLTGAAGQPTTLSDGQTKGATTRQLAHKIALRIFTNGGGEAGTELDIRCQGRTYKGSWCYSDVVNMIIETIDNEKSERGDS
jgi:hypothetical protein